MVTKQDDIYATQLDKMVDFQFDERVANVFPDMIQRSVPGYATLINQMGILAASYAQADSVCYDLGCSLGAVSLSMRRAIKQQGCKIIAVDNSAAMIDRAQEVLSVDNHSLPIELVCADIQDIEIQNASIVVMNFTLQFIAIEQRQALINKIYQGLKPGGIFILSEKLTFTNKTIDEFYIANHHEFKKANGYSDLEVSQKRTAIENVLIPETLAQHQNRLTQAGFQLAEQWFQSFNFASIAAVK